jgi:hypothetical protein
MFNVGQKVECIGYPPTPKFALYPSAQVPKVGGIYVIRAVNDWPDEGVTRLRFVGLDNSHLLPKMGGRIEPGFNSIYFRPIVERKTDISIFTAMLTPTKRKVLAVTTGHGGSADR